MIKDRMIESISKQVRDNANKTYTKRLAIEIHQGSMPLRNQQCMYNAVHGVKHLGMAAVIECVIIHSNTCVAHYINQREDGSYVDLTLGWTASGADYRFVRMVRESDYPYPCDLLDNLKSNLIGSRIGWLQKLLGIHPVDIC